VLSASLRVNLLPVPLSLASVPALLFLAFAVTLRRETADTQRQAARKNKKRFHNLNRPSGLDLCQ
jgi:hypothetical protein